MTDNPFIPPAAEGLPLAALDSATEGADRLDAMARTPYGRNVLAHALVQLARDGWLRPEPGEGFETVRDRETPEPADEPAPAVSSPLPDQTAEDRQDRYAEAIHDAMELDLSLVDQEPGVQALFACAAEAAVALADAERAAVCICGHTEQQHFEDACLICDCGDYLPPAAAREVIARYQAAVKQMAADRAAVLTEASRVADGIADAMGKAEESWASRANWACATVGVQLRRLAAEAQQQPDTETPAYDRTAWEAYRRDAGCACTSPDPSTCAVSHRSGPWLCVCHRLSAELTEEERAALFPERQFDRPESTWAAPRTATGARLRPERRENVPHEPDGPEEPSGAR